MAGLNWNHNEWDGDAKWDDKPHATIEALRAIAEQLARIADLQDNIQYQKEQREEG